MILPLYATLKEYLLVSLETTVYTFLAKLPTNHPYLSLYENTAKRCLFLTETTYRAEEGEFGG